MLKNADKTLRIDLQNVEMKMMDIDENDDDNVGVERRLWSLDRSVDAVIISWT